MHWRILLGGWDGTRSMIDSLNPYSRCTNKNHTRNDFNTLKENFEVHVADGSITINNHENGKIFMKCSEKKISKSNLTHMLASSGHLENSGNLQIEKIKGWSKLDQTWSFKSLKGT